MSDAPARAAVTALKLWNFRNYEVLRLDLDARPVVLTGPNGVGKTNLLEAVSFLAPGRGLRRALLTEVAREGSDGAWAVAAEVDGRLGPATIGTGIARGEGEAVQRRIRINGAPARVGDALAEHLGVLWLTPAMDGLFTGPGSDRRRFLDRLVLNLDNAHAGRVNAYDRAVRHRNRLLDAGEAEPALLDAIEVQIAELGVAIAAARREAVERLRRLISEADGPGPFPTAGIRIEGTVEGLLDASAALEAEDRFRAILRASRARDRAAGRTLEGPHRSDLKVLHAEKGVPAERASTGEQKALLIGLVLAEARLVTALTGVAPVLLLDEVAAHLDAERRTALFDALLALGAQAWLTGTDAAAFAALDDRAQRLAVREGRIETEG